MTLDEIDISQLSPYNGALTAAAICIDRGLNPARFRVSSYDYMYIQFNASYLHEYIDEEGRSYLVLRTPSKLLVYVDPKQTRGVGTLECKSPDVEVQIKLAC